MWKKCENLEEYTEEHYNNKEEMQIAEAPGRVFFSWSFYRYPVVSSMYYGYAVCL